jgi:hypothetical protein
MMNGNEELESIKSQKIFLTNSISDNLHKLRSLDRKIPINVDHHKEDHKLNQLGSSQILKKMECNS